MKRLTVEVIEDPRGLRAFIRFPEILYRCGLLTDGFQYPPRIMMPHNPSYYPTLLERVGLRPVRELLSYDLDVPPALPEAVGRVASAASVRGVRVRSLDPSRLSAEAEAFRSIYNAA